MIALGIAAVMIAFCIAVACAIVLTGLYFAVLWISGKVADVFFGRVSGGRK